MIAGTSLVGEVEKRGGTQEKTERESHESEYQEVDECESWLG